MQNQEINLTLTAAETDVILEALGTLPFNKVSGIFNKVMTQGQTQLRAIADAMNETEEVAEEVPSNAEPIMEVVEEPTASAEG